MNNTEIVDLAKQLGERLAEKSMKISTAESCTGGAIAMAITEISGSSEWFECGFVTYSNQSKMQMLGVNPEFLQQYGAVSEQVAIEMVAGALQNSAADLAVAVTGIAGPGGGTEDKPVGTVYIAWGFKQQGIRCKKHVFLGNRATIRKKTIISALKSCLNQAEVSGRF